MRQLSALLLLICCATASAQISAPIQSFGGPAVATNTAVLGPGGTLTITGTGFSVGGSTNTGGNFVTNSTGTYFLGEIDGGSAPAGYVGEFVSTTPVGAQNLPASNTIVSIATTTLMPGDWDVTGGVDLETGAGFSGTWYDVAISLVANNMDNSQARTQSAFAMAASQSYSIPIITRRILITSPTAVYLTGRVTYSVLGGSTFGTGSFLRARRIR